MDQTTARPQRPLAPDFASHQPTAEIREVHIDGPFVSFAWSDGLVARFHSLWLRENEVAPGVIDEVTREREIEIDQLPDGVTTAEVSMPGPTTVEIRWAPDDAVSRFDAGWLRSMAEGRWKPGFDIPDRIPWDRTTLTEPPTFDGPSVLQSDVALEDFLLAAWTHGFARLRDLPVEEGTVQRVGERIGTVRSSNFGFLFTVETKPDPDSSAYTSVALDGHTDLASRELQPGLQMLLCRENTATGGASTMADGFAVAAAIRDTDPSAFKALTQSRWVFTNRHRNTDYRYSGPIVELNTDGDITEIRNTGFLRAYPDMPDDDMPEAYRALRLFTALCRSDRFLCKTPFRAGDLVLFDNRRILHGRDSFDPQSGVRRLEGCYLDHDEILSRLRILARNRRAAEHGTFGS